jgi:ABC-type amino acid transport substrate-binding protein
VPTATATCSRTLTAVFPLPNTGPAQGGMVTHDRWLADQVGGAIGCTIRTEAMPPPRARSEFINGRVDILWSLQSAELEKVGRFVGNVPVPGWLLVTTRAPGTIPEHLADFLNTPSLKVAGIRGGSENELLKTDVDRLAQAGQWDEAIDYETLMRKLVAGRDAAALVIAPFYTSLAARYPDAPLRAIEQTQYPSPRGGAYVSRLTLPAEENEVISAALDRAIQQDVAPRQKDP